MKEIKGNIFDITDADAICVTTNGVLDTQGALVMGAGLALQFKNKYTGIAVRLGKKVKQFGNHCHTDWVSFDSRTLVSVPTKEHWKDPSPMWLIERSAHELAALADKHKWRKIVLPRLGTGLGGLKWEDVKAVISPILDDRFFVITPENN